MVNFLTIKKLFQLTKKSLIVSSKDFISSIERVASVSLDRKEGVKLAINKEKTFNFLSIVQVQVME